MGNMPLDQSHLAEFGAFYRKHLIDDVMSFWDRRVTDPDGPGYLILYDRKGHLTGTDKFMWCQARQTYMFAALYNFIEQRDDWLELARRGRNLLVDYGHAGNGRFHYRLDRAGKVLDARRSAFTDSFALIGLCEYAIASGSEEDKALIEQTYDALAEHIMIPGFDEWHHHPLDPAYRWHGPHMIGVGCAGVARPVLGERVDQLAQYCLNQILNVFSKPNYQCTFELLDMEGNVVETDLGLRINPGHAIESAWFCMEEALLRGDGGAFDLAVRNCDWAYRLGYDVEHGGVLAFTNPYGGRPAGTDNWDSKIWWVQAEALYALALAAVEKDSVEHFKQFIDLHDYCQRLFHDSEYGEWYCCLDRQGRATATSKGNWVKSAFHLPRALMKLVLLFERVSDLSLAASSR